MDHHSPFRDSFHQQHGVCMRGWQWSRRGRQEERAQWNLKRMWTQVLAAQLIPSELPGQDLSRALIDLIHEQVSTWHDDFKTGHYQVISHCYWIPHYHKAVVNHSSFFLKTHHLYLSSGLFCVSFLREIILECNWETGLQVLSLWLCY